MSKVWRRLQRVGKKATKYRLATLGHVLTINCNSKWQPDKICLTWSHRNRKYQSKFSKWEPGLKNVYEGVVEWEKSSDQIEFDVTLYKSINEDQYEEKEWILMVESEDPKGKRRLLATGKLNVEKYVSIEPFFQTDIKDLKLKPASSKIKSSSISFSIACQFIKDGKATDEDMISIASFMSTASSTNNNNPYLNSNYLFDQKFNNEDEDDLDEEEYINSNKRQTLTSTKLAKPSSRNEFDEQSEKIPENDDDDIDYFFNLQSQTLNSNFNSIAYNFSNNNNNNNTLISDLTLSANPVPVIKSPSITLNSSSSSSATLIRMPSISTLPSLTNVTTSTKLKASHSNSGLASKNKLNEETKFSNPFEDNPDTSNPFEEGDKTETDTNNPFLETNEINNNQESRNPFLESKNSEFAIELDRNSNIMIVKSKSKEMILNEKEPVNELINNSSNTTKDLLDWCRDIINCSKSSSGLFENLVINDFSTSWNNGLAFCAIIHHYRPKLIDLNKLSETDAKANLKQAFTASDKESIVRVVDYSDILNKKNVDQLSIMTYLYQIRDRYDSQNVNNQIQSMKKSKSAFASLKPQAPINPVKVQSKESNKENQMASVKNEEKSKQTNKYFNPFDSDDEQPVEVPKSPRKNQAPKAPNTETVKKLPPPSGLIQIKPDGQIIDAVETNPFENTQDKNSNKINRIIENGQKTNRPSPSSPVKEVNSSEELIQKAKDLIQKNKAPLNTLIDQDLDGSKKDEIKQRAKQIIAETKKQTRRKSSSASVKKETSDSTSTNENLNIVDVDNQLKEDQLDELIGTEYINQEILNLKNKQNELDERGNYIEKQLRVIMKKTSAPNAKKENPKEFEKDKELEDKLLRDWFLLINEKNALLHQQQELEILQNEKSLEKRYEILSNQLRNLMAIDDFVKTDEQKKTESILFNELISLVNKRNELVIQLDEENKLLNEGEYINDFIQNKDTFQPKQKQCIIQ